MTLAVNRRLTVWLLGALLALGGCASDEPAVSLSGGVFGTTWSLVYVPPEDAPAPDEVEAALVAAFNVINRQMNHYDADSTISEFNRMPPEQTLEVGWDFAYLLTEAMRIGEQTDGAYDVTVSPVINLWGFGPEGPTNVPAESEIATALARVGSDKLDWSSTERMLAKRVDGVSLDFSSIAKGYGVDLGADALDALGLKRYMLEIGGEVRLRGLSPRGDRWRIAIERPDSAPREVQAAISATDIGIATSGDYRNYFERDGQRFSHLIDPRTGRPIVHDLVSVTVLHPSTAIADAWATALIVLGYEDARAITEQLAWPVYFVRRAGDDLRVEWTPAMADYLLEPGA
jgi:thiamine biosynthesis lipoprotein